jgi:hypothetical protein
MERLGGENIHTFSLVSMEFQLMEIQWLFSFFPFHPHAVKLSEKKKSGEIDF